MARLEESRLCPQPSAAEKGEGRADVPLLDDVVGYAPALLLSEGSQHCVAMVTPCAAVASASQTQVAAGKSPLPPSST